MLGSNCEKRISAYIWDMHLLLQFTVYLVNELCQHSKCYHSGPQVLKHSHKLDASLAPCHFVPIVSCLEFHCSFTFQDIKVAKYLQHDFFFFLYYRYKSSFSPSSCRRTRYGGLLGSTLQRKFYSPVIFHTTNIFDSNIYYKNELSCIWSVLLAFLFFYRS